MKSPILASYIAEQELNLLWITQGLIFLRHSDGPPLPTMKELMDLELSDHGDDYVNRALLAGWVPDMIAVENWLMSLIWPDSELHMADLNDDNGGAECVEMVTMLSHALADGWLTWFSQNEHAIQRKEIPWQN